MLDNLRELVDYVKNIEKESAWMAYEKSGSPEYDNVVAYARAKGGQDVCIRILEKIHEMQQKDDILERFKRIVSDKKYEAILEARHFSKTRNYEGLARMYEVENVCEDILYEFNRLTEERNESL